MEQKKKDEIKSQPEQATNELDYICIGRILKPYGLVGEVKVEPSSFDLDRHEDLKKVFYRKSKLTPAQTLEVRGSRLHQEYWFLKFKGFRTPEKAKELSGCELLIHSEDRLPLPEDLIYISDLIGFDAVSEQGETIGPVTQVIENAANELILVDYKGKEITIPWVPGFVKEIQKSEKKVIVLWDRLAELYEN